MTEKNKRLDALAQSPEERIRLAKLYDRLWSAYERKCPAWTDFLTRREQALLEQLLPGVPLVMTGGLPQAERKIACFLPDYCSPEDVLTGENGPLCGYRAGFYGPDGLSHRDFLGSLMGCGIKRETVGDLYVSENFCDFVVLREIAPYLEQNFTSVGRGKIRLSPISLDRLQAPAPAVREIRDTVSSLRLDSVAAAGFQISRGKAAQAVERGLVQVNWLPCLKPDRAVEPGDTISGRGLGKFELREITGRTKKDRIGILLGRYE